MKNGDVKRKEIQSLCQEKHDQVIEWRQQCKIIVSETLFDVRVPYVLHNIIQEYVLPIPFWQQTEPRRQWISKYSDLLTRLI